MEPIIHMQTATGHVVDVSGTLLSTIEPGDFILVRNQKTFFDRLIAIGQSVRFTGENRKYAQFVHAALVVSPSGELIESDSSGVKRTTINDYVGQSIILVKLNVSSEDRMEATNFAMNCLQEGYGWLCDISIGLSLLTGLKFAFGFDGQEICSGLVARSLEHAGEIFQRDASHMSPADLAQIYLSKLALD